MILAGFTGLGLGAGSLAFASIPDVAEMICACCHKTVSTDSLEPPPALVPHTASTSNSREKEQGQCESFDC